MGLRKWLSEENGLSVLAFILFGLVSGTLIYAIYGENVEEVRKPEFRRIQAVQDIITIDSSLVLPIIYQNVPSLETLPVAEKKEKFIAIMLPSILIAKEGRLKITDRLEGLLAKQRLGEAWAKEDSLFFTELSQEYKAIDLNDLILRLTPPPNSIILAQAALESGWGTSRFFYQASNVFGIWSFDKSEPRVKAKGGRKGHPVYVRAYENITLSIEDYFDVLAKGKAYNKFRERRGVTDNPFELIWHLRKYSELRDRYITMLAKTIINNNMARYDHYSLDWAQRNRHY